MDDDIDVLSHGEHDFSEDPLFNPRADNLSNMHISFTKDDKDGSLHALQTAYMELKKRYRDQECRINSLQIVIRDMETQRISNMRPNSGVYGAAGPSSASAVSPAVDDYQIRAEFGFAKNLERQLIRAKTNLRNLESERKDLLSKVDSFQKDIKRLQLLNQDKDKLIESLQNELRARGSQTSSPQVKSNSAEVSRLKEQVQILTNLIEEKDKHMNYLKLKCQNLESKLVSQDRVSITSEEQKQLLYQVDQYSQTMQDLKDKVNYQSKILQDQQGLMKKLITESKPNLTSPILRYAEGASYGPQHIGSSVDHGYVKFEMGQPRAEQCQGLPGNTAYPTLMTLNDRTGEKQIETKRSKIPQTSTWMPVESGTCLVNVCDVDNNIDRIPRVDNPQFLRRNSGGKSAPQENECIADNAVVYTIAEPDFRVGQGKRTKSPQMQYVQPEISVYENLIAFPNVNDSKPKSPRSSYTSNVDKNIPNLSRKTSEHSPYSTSRESARENEDYINVDNIHPGQRPLPLGLSKKVVTEDPLEINTPIASSNARINQAEENAVFPSADQLCPVCNQKFPNMNIEDFQLHVLNCMDNDIDEEEQFVTMQNNEHVPIVHHAGSNNDNRICPMCDASFPAELPQSEFERHVQEHFGEDPIMDRFEVLHP